MSCNGENMAYYFRKVFLVIVLIGIVFLPKSTCLHELNPQKYVVDGFEQTKSSKQFVNIHISKFQALKNH